MRACVYVCVYSLLANVIWPLKLCMLFGVVRLCVCVRGLRGPWVDHRIGAKVAFAVSIGRHPLGMTWGEGWLPPS